MMKWYTSKVIKGSQKGREIGFPTANLADPSILKEFKEGVYLTRVKVDTIPLWGMLYLGPRLVAGETKTSLEIYLFDFDKNIYGKDVEFEVLDYIRPVIDIKSFEELKNQLEKDERDARDFIKMVTTT